LRGGGLSVGQVELAEKCPKAVREVTDLFLLDPRSMVTISHINSERNSKLCKYTEAYNAAVT